MQGGVMDDDRGAVKRALELQALGRDYPMNQLPGYMDWSERKLAEGENAALIAHLDGTCMWLTPARRRSQS